MEENEIRTPQPLWFEEWFNSPYYHKLYCHRNEEEARFFIDNLLKKLELPKGAKILDLACGKGRHAIYLNTLGYDVTGIDLSEENIATAQISENQTLSFFVHDMRQLYWNEYFDCILNLFTSFGYFDDENDNLKTLQSVHDSLKPGGTFVIDFMNAEKAIQNLIQQETVVSDGTEFHISREATNTHIHKTIEVREGEKIHRFSEKVQLLREEDFEKLFESARLKINAVWGDYSLNPFHEETSERLIIKGTKKINE